MHRLLVLAVLAAVTAIGRADEPAQTITVTASATVFVKPDAARIHYSVRASESSMDAAKDAAAKQVTTVNDAIKALKFSDLSTSVGAATFDRTVTRAAGRPGGFGGPGNPNGNPQPAVSTIHYAVVPLTATIREKDAGKLHGSVELFVRRVTELGGQVANDSNDDVVQGWGGPGVVGGRSRYSSSETPRIEWLITDDTAARQEAYRAAVRKAKANAEAISKEIGWETLKVVSVVDGASLPREPGEPSPRAPAGEVGVTAKVTLKFSR